MVKKLFLYSMAVILTGAAAHVNAGTYLGHLGEVVVTPRRRRTTLAEIPGGVTVITREDIERSQKVSLPEVLSGVPGLDVTIQGGYGKVSSVFNRGTNSGHTLVLVDGIKVNSATTGGAAWQHMPLAQVERIEVVRGPHSGLYGSEAVGGIVQVFTRKGEGPPQFSGEAGYGQYNTQYIRGNYSGEAGNSHFSVSAETLRSDGFDAQQNQVEDAWGFPTPDEPDDDGYSKDSVSLQFSHRFGERAEVVLHGMRSWGDVEYDDAAPWANESEFLNQAAGVTAYLEPAAGWNLTLRGGQARDEAEYYRDGEPLDSRFSTVRRQVSLQNDIKIAPRQVHTVGIDLQRDDVGRSTTEYDETRRDNIGIFLQHQAGWGRHDISLGARYDDNEAFGEYTTGQANYSYRLSDNVQFLAGIGTAFREPVFNELYWPDTGLGGGNSDLSPEGSESIEIGYRGQHEWGRWELRAFRTYIRNLIAGWPPENVAGADIEGVEMGMTTEVFGWRLGGSFTVLDARDADTDNWLPRRAGESLRLDAGRQIGAGRFGTAVFIRGKSYDDFANTVSLDGFTTVDLRLEYPLYSSFLLRGRVENLLDTEYQTAHTYNSPRRGYFVSVGYRPN